MRVEVLAVGTELLLGQIVDTNSAWMGEQLALAGIDSHFHQVVGDNQARIVLALRTALARSDGVVVCGGLGPTHDDITRDAIAEVMNVPLVRDAEIVARDRRDVQLARSGHAREQRTPGRRARRRHGHPPAAGHRARAHLPRRPQGRLRPARRALRARRDVHPGRAPRPARPRRCGRRGGGDHRAAWCGPGG